MKVLVLSDLHLGARATRAPGRWDEIARVASEFDRVILNGDTLDRCYDDPRDDEKASELIADAKKYCASRNGPPKILSGNHDPVISDTALDLTMRRLGRSFFAAIAFWITRIGLRRSIGNCATN